MLFLSNYRPMHLLPNVDGFEFIGLTNTEPFCEVPCRVEKGDDGLHRVANDMLQELQGWRATSERVKGCAA